MTLILTGVLCKKLVELTNAKSSSFGMFFYEDVVNYMCDIGYETKSKNTSIKTVCGHTGDWVVDEPDGCFRKNLRIYVEKY